MFQCVNITAYQKGFVTWRGNLSPISEMSQRVGVKYRASLLSETSGLAFSWHMVISAHAVKSASDMCERVWMSLHGARVLPPEN